MTLRISEIFYSIQGEGIYQGVPTVFIRLAGCNLLTHCQYCDTSYAWDGNLGIETTVEEVLNKVVKFSPHYKDWVCITGGEPLFQPDELHQLVKKLKNYGYRIEVETNGSIKKPFWWTLVDSWVADIKCPSSAICGVSLVDDWFSMRRDDQVKFVVGNQEDLDFARKVINSKVAYNPVVLVSPILGMGMDLADKENIPDEIWYDVRWLQEVAEFCIELRVRLSLQLHKFVWGSRRGATSWQEA